MILVQLSSLFPPREKPGCVISPDLCCIDTGPAGFFPSLGCSAGPFGKDVSILGLLPASIAILSLRLLLLHSFLALSLSMPCFLFFGKLILLMWWECHEFSTSPLGFLAWPSSFFNVLYQVVSLGCPLFRMLALACPSVSVSLTLLILLPCFIFISF